MKVYIITAGQYSNNRICAVAENPEKAEILRQIYDRKTGHDHVEIRVYDTDDYDPEYVGRPFYEVWLDDKGNLMLCDEQDDTCWYGDMTYHFRRADNHFFITLYADNEEAAVKIAAETRAKALAEKLGL